MEFHGCERTACRPEAVLEVGLRLCFGSIALQPAHYHLTLSDRCQAPQDDTAHRITVALMRLATDMSGQLFAPRIHSLQYSYARTAARIHSLQYSYARTAARIHSLQYSYTRTAARIHSLQYSYARTAARIHSLQYSYTRTAARIHSLQYSYARTAARIHSIQYS